MSSTFCCESIKPYKPRRLDHESKFTAFMNWAQDTNADAQPEENADDSTSKLTNAPYAVQLVRQINFGPLESKRYFIPLGGDEGPFNEIFENDLVEANFKKLNS